MEQLDHQARMRHEGGGMWDAGRTWRMNRWPEASQRGRSQSLAFPEIKSGDLVDIPKGRPEHGSFEYAFRPMFHLHDETICV